MREELNAAVVKRINQGSLLIPVVIDACEVPESLKSTLWSRIIDLNNYDEEFNRIVTAIFGCREKPPLLHPPKYTQVTVDTLPGLTEVDALIFNRACQHWLTDKARGIQSAEVLASMADLQIPQEAFLESLEILAAKGYIDPTRLFGGAIPCFRITHYGFEHFLRRIYSGYDTIYDQVCLAILNLNLTRNREIAQNLSLPISIIDHVMDDLDNRGLARTQKFFRGGRTIFSIFPELRRHYRNNCPPMP